MNLADRLFIPEDTEAILWDMDGVLIDSLSLDLTVCNKLLNKYIDKNINLSKQFIRSLFAYHPPEFWRLISEHVQKEYRVSISSDDFDIILETYNEARNNSSFEVNPGILELLASASALGLKNAVVSNTPTEDLRKILSLSNILDKFDQITGNDINDLKINPAPNTYLFTAKELGVNPKRCVVIEDSLLGVRAGNAAKCFTIGVATGGADFQDLENTSGTNQVYLSFLPNQIDMQFGNVTIKSIITPNEFVSHMVEHIAWRLGCEISLQWNNNDWLLLGQALGEKIKALGKRKESGVALGMIDDGSAEVLIKLSEKSDLKISSTGQVDLDWFMSLRCEQINSGKPLEDLIKGLANGLGMEISLRVCSVEDPHHSWEGVFRAIGIALYQIFKPEAADNQQGNVKPGKSEKKVSPKTITVDSVSCNFAEVSRKTAESQTTVIVDFSKKEPSGFSFQTSSSIKIDPLGDLLAKFAEEAGFSLQVDYKATALSSSHVVMEDTALVLGRALKEILVLRMEQYGVNGAGSSPRIADDYHTQPVRVGVSVEGRKFFKVIPFQDSFDDIRKKFLIGQKIYDCLFSEDLDDFLDGLANGLACSITIHMNELPDPDQGWQMLFQNLGKAISEVFELNPFRKNVPPGVKATLD